MKFGKYKGEVLDLILKNYSSKNNAELIKMVGELGVEISNYNLWKIGSYYKLRKNIGVNAGNKNYKKNYQFPKEKTTSKGEKLVYCPEHPRCKDRKQKYISLKVLVMEENLGRYLKKGECVTQIDGDISNVNIDNLKLSINYKEDIKTEDIKKLLDEGYMVEDILKELNISRATYYNRIKDEDIRYYKRYK